MTRILLTGILAAMAAATLAAPAAAAAVTAVQEQPARFQTVQNMGGGGEAFMASLSEEERGRLTEMMRRGQQLRLLDDASVREELKISPEQLEKFTALKEKVTALGNKLREELQEKIQGMARPDMTPEEQAAMRQEIIQVVGNTVRSNLGYLEDMVQEADTIMTPAQRDQLVQVTSERTLAEIATGPLAVLLTPQAKEELGLSGDQVAQIRVMLKGLEADYREMRDKMFGAGKEPTADDLKTEKGQDFKRLHQELITKTRDRILTIFGPEQREKTEKYLAARVARTGRGGRTGMGMRNRGGQGGPGAQAPAAPGATAPGAPAPAEK